jgi:tRNA modification GTPase
MRPSDALLDTIVAPATPPGRSAIALVRLSGPRTLAILAALAPGLPAAPSPRRPYLVGIVDETGAPIDTALLTYFAAPASMTGEDVGEISVHGSPAAVERLLRAASATGARLARAGEFTERAFRAGKLDLLRVEAVRDLIEARTAAAAAAGARRLAGSLSDAAGRVRDRLLEASAGLAAAIDFSDDVGEGVPPGVEAALSGAIADLARLAGTWETGRLLSEGCRVAILGPPNVGKSTLFNAAVGSERAIVTEIAGTTRDTLEAVLDVRGIPVTLIDTAGLRASEDPVERIGVARAHSEAERADAIVYVFDASAGFTDDDARRLTGAGAGQPLIPVTAKTPRLLIANKADRRGASAPALPPDARLLCGLAPDAGEALRGLLAETLSESIRGEEASEVLGSLRQRDLVEAARRAAEETVAALRDGLSPEYAATHCHTALDALADLVGETTSEDVLARVFASFCIGK